MRLVFDTTVLAQAARSERSRTGIHRYASQLLPALERSGDLHGLGYCRDPLLRGWQSATDSPAALAPSLRGLLRHPALVRPAKPLWRALQASPWARRRQRLHLDDLLHAAGIDPERAVYHSPYAAIPPEVRRAGFGGVVLTIHDMLPLIEPHLFPRETVRGFRTTLASLRPGDHLVCVSGSTRDDVLRLQRTVPAAQVHVVPLAAATGLAPVQDPAALEVLRQRFGLEPGERLILSLGTLEPRKNLLLTLEAFQRLRARHPATPFRLMLVGAQGWQIAPLLRRLKSDGLDEAVRLSGFVEDAMLAGLYSCADVFVYPSLYEGFGLPPLEAMQCGTPVIVSRRSSLPEVVGEAGLQVDPLDPDDLCAALERVLLDPSTRYALARQGLERARTFHWRRTAEETAQVYRLALERR